MARIVVGWTGLNKILKEIVNTPNGLESLSRLNREAIRKDGTVIRIPEHDCHLSENDSCAKCSYYLDEDDMMVGAGGIEDR